MGADNTADQENVQVWTAAVSQRGPLCFTPSGSSLVTFFCFSKRIVKNRVLVFLRRRRWARLASGGTVTPVRNTTRSPALPLRPIPLLVDRPPRAGNTG